MRFISTKVHAWFDYIGFAALIIAPWLLGFSDIEAATIIPVVVGAVGILYSLFTDYEGSVSRQISMSTHLTLDFIAGLFLAISPWLFGFNEYIWWPHLIVGVVEMFFALFTNTVPDYCPEDAPCYQYSH
jgi:hypothetical protein